MRNLRLLAVASVVLALWAGTAFAGAGTGLNVPPDPSGIGDPAPDFILEELGTGKKIKLSSYFGKKVVMLEFWATWCNICKIEIPNLVKEYDEWKGKKYQLLAVTLSDGGKQDLKKINELKEKHSINYPILIDKGFEVATKLYKLSGPIPLKIIIDCAGNIRYEHVGDFADGVSEVPFVLEALTAEPSCK